VALSVFALFLCFAPSPAAAGPDLSTGLGFRAVPFGTAVFGEAGWGGVVWGQKSGPADFLYGYVRGAARYAGSGLVNRGDAWVTLAPISILALDLGLTARERFIDKYATVECSGHQCKGLVRGSFARVRTVLGYGPTFAIAALTLEQLTPERAHDSFVDEQSALVAGDPAHAANGDLRRERALVVGAKLPGALSRWNAGYVYQDSQMLRAGTGSRQHALFNGFQITPNWSAMGGLGLYESSTYSRGPTAFVRLQWSDFGSVELN